ncbi:MAG: type II toxin-antitoxin system VapC family toxin [Acidobacteria bacterium]|nr:type II toxin-antitoxin system VapC family toxin [Acidobacteriota bacterium]
MRLLLDTHIWIWSVLQPHQLSQLVAQMLSDTGNELWLSPISVCELVYLVEKRRLELDLPTGVWLQSAMQRLAVREAVVSYQVALETNSVRLPYRDPADRLLVATARVYDLTVVTADERLLRVPGLPVLANR